jgi:hypothetical protein
MHSLREVETPLLRVQVGPMAVEVHRPRLALREAWMGACIAEREYPESPRYRRSIYVAPVPFVGLPLEIEVS